MSEAYLDSCTCHLRIKELQEQLRVWTANAKLYDRKRMEAEDRCKELESQRDDASEAWKEKCDKLESRLGMKDEVIAQYKAASESIISDVGNEDVKEAPGL